MAGFRTIIGHDDIIRHLQNAIVEEKVSNAYIFAGETGSGKKLIASTFAMTLQCKDSIIEPCMKCESCKKAEGRVHPDIIYVHHEKPNTISIEEIREQVVNDVDIKPYSSPYKIYIIPDAQKMTVQAQNALLKTIEEPPAYAVIILLTTNADELLQTIRSRCIELNLKPVSDMTVKNYLMEKLNIPSYQAEIHASFAQGSIGKAREAALSAEFESRTNKALDILKNIMQSDVNEMTDYIQDISDEKEYINDYLDIFQFWFRDVLMFKATREVDHLVFKQELNIIKEQAREKSYENLENILNALEKSRVRLRANVNFDLTLELLFLTIREK